MIVTKRLDLELLQTELATAGVPVIALGTTGTLETADYEVWTYDASGALIDLPPAAVPVVDAHVAPPLVVDHVRTIAVDAIVRTTDAALSEVFRLTTETRHLYRATFSMMAVDAVSADSKDVEVRLNFRQQAGAAVQVGSTRPLYDPIETPAAASWAIQGAAAGPDFLVGVRGAVGRTIDWALTGQIAVYAPDGLDGGDGG